MSNIVDGAVGRLNEKLAGGSFAGTAKFEIQGEGSIIVDSDGARAGDEVTDVTMSADADTFQSILAGDADPTAAFMSGKLSVEGDMAIAMQMAAALA